MNEKSEFRRKADELAKKMKNQNFMWLYLATIFVWVILFLIKLFLWGMDIQGLISSVLDNMLGLLPPMFIFDFVYEKLTRDASTMETSEKITETMMGKPETLALFTEEQRRTFINSAISSIAPDETTADMIQQCLSAYLTTEPCYKIRPQFHYDIRLQCNSIPENSIFSNADYFYVEEVLSYQIKYPKHNSEKFFPDGFWVGFFAKSDKLDSALRDKISEEDNRKYIFRESLSIRKCDLDKLKSLPQEELREVFNRVFKLKIRVDEKYAAIQEIIVNDLGIFINMKSDHDSSNDLYAVRVLFHMPQCWETEIVISISDPTYSPEIMVSYQEDIMNVEMYSFFSESDESSVENAVDTDNGIYSVAVVNRWIYPMSGMVFTIKKEADAEDITGN